jgi:hypothetical protein
VNKIKLILFAILICKQDQYAINMRKWYTCNMNEINWYHTFRFFFFFTRFHFFYSILWVNVQINVHFYIFFQITIYSDRSLADEIWWTFKKERTGHLEKISNMDYDFFFFCHLNWSILNTDQESTHECKL